MADLENRRSTIEGTDRKEKVYPIILYEGNLYRYPWGCNSCVGPSVFHKSRYEAIVACGLTILPSWKMAGP